MSLVVVLPPGTLFINQRIKKILKVFLNRFLLWTGDLIYEPVFDANLDPSNFHRLRRTRWLLNPSKCFHPSPDFRKSYFFKWKKKLVDFWMANIGTDEGLFLWKCFLEISWISQNFLNFSEIIFTKIHLLNKRATTLHWLCCMSHFDWHFIATV